MSSLTGLGLMLRLFLLAIPVPLVDFDALELHLLSDSCDVALLPFWIV